MVKSVFKSNSTSVQYMYLYRQNNDVTEHERSFNTKEQIEDTGKISIQTSIQHMHSYRQNNDVNITQERIDSCHGGSGHQLAKADGFTHVLQTHELNDEHRRQTVSHAAKQTLHKHKQ
jgi:hypothetical protein